MKKREIVAFYLTIVAILFIALVFSMFSRSFVKTDSIVAKELEELENNSADDVTVSNEDY